MFSPRPYGLFVYGGELSGEDRAAIDNFATKLTNFKTASGLDSAKYTRSLPDGGFVIIQDMGGVFRALAFKEEIPSVVTMLDGEASDYIPMLFSGVIKKSVLKNGEGLDLELTNWTQRRIVGYGDVPASSAQKLKRFRCGYNPEFREFKPPNADAYSPEALLYTQYAEQRPTWYSGAMAEVIQIVGGFGRQDLTSLPDDPIERALFVLPTKIKNDIKQELKGIRLPAYLGVPHEKGEFQYSYRFNKTHLISFDSTMNPWLVQIDPSGVWAMPLPIIPATRTDKFKQYIQETGDDELLKILDRFGAIPSGEAFPTGSNFQDWQRAGVIIKVCDSGQFYSHSPYTTACGWSSNLDGSEAINTCYDYADNGYCVGFAYMLKLKLSPAINQGWVDSQSISQISDPDRGILSNYLSELFALLNSSSVRDIAIRYKIRRTSPDDILSRARNGRVNENEVNYWNNLTLPPIATHQGSVKIISSGYLFDGVRIKLPEPFLGGCVSMDFTPLHAVEKYPRINTIVFGYYIGDDLKVIKNFKDDRVFSKAIEGNFEDVMVVGSWEQTETSGSTGLSGDYYSTDFDDRAEQSPVTTTTKIIGMDLGYGTPRALYAGYFWTDGLLTRSKYYTHQTDTRQESGKLQVVAFVVNYYNRNMCTYFRSEATAQTIRTSKMELKSVADPNSYGFWTYDFGLHWFALNSNLKKTGKPFPADGNPVWAEEHYYKSDDARADFADEGDWIGGLPANISNLVNPPSGGITLLEYGGVPPSVDEYEDRVVEGGSTKDIAKISYLKISTTIHSNEHSYKIYGRSPDDNQNLLYQDGCKVVFGLSMYANISISGDTSRYRWGYTKLADHKSAHHFIGVINE